MRLVLAIFICEPLPPLCCGLLPSTVIAPVYLENYVVYGARHRSPVLPFIPEFGSTYSLPATTIIQLHLAPRVGLARAYRVASALPSPTSACARRASGASSANCGRKKDTE